MNGRLLAVALCGSACLVSGPTYAAPYIFNLSGPQTISFTLDSSPTPTVYSAGDFFQIDGISGTVNGQPSTFSAGFGSASYSNDFGLSGPTVGTQVLGTGAQLYTGTEANPTFKLGTFTLHG